MIRAVERALAILDAFDTQHQTLSLQEISKQVAMPKSTAFRLVSTLQRSGFLVRMENQRYSLSLKVLRLAGLVRSTLSVRQAARPIMLEACKKTGETVTLNLRSGIDRICIDVVDTPSALMAIVRTGEHVGLLYGATARLLLAYAPDTEIDDIIARTPSTEDLDVAALRTELANIRSQGYACSSGQRIPGVTAISAPIIDANHEVHYSIAVTGPSIRMNSRVNEFKKIVIEAAASISNLIGGSVPNRPAAEAGPLEDKTDSSRSSGFLKPEPL